MAIEEYGASLLSDVRRRQDKQAKQMRKEQERTALMGLGLTVGVQVGNEYLRNKAQSFFNNEDVLKQRIAFKNMNRQLERDIKARDAYEAQGFNYFLTEEIERIREPMKAAAGANYSPALFEQHLYAEAEKNAKERERLFKERLPEIENFIANGGADPAAYSEVLKKTQPQSLGDLVRGAVSSFVGGDSNAMHMRNLRTLDTSLNEYKEVYAQTKNPFASRTFAQFKDDFKDIDFGQTPVQMKELKNIKLPDGTEQTALVATQNDQVVGLFDPTNGQTLQPVAGDNARKRRQNIPQGIVEATRIQFNDIVDTTTGAGKVIQDYYDDVAGGLSTRDKDRIESHQKDIWGGLHQTSAAIEQRVNIKNPDVSLLLAAEMHAMNIENTREKTGWFNQNTKKRPQYNLLATKDSFSPILALAALERIERKEEGSIVGLNERNITRIRSSILNNSTDADYMESFGNLSMASKLYTLRWMKDYDTFTAPINKAGESIIDRLMKAYNIQGKI